MKIIVTLKFIWYSRLSDEKALTIRQLLEGPLEEEIIDYSNELPNILYLLFITFIYWTIAPVINILAGILFGAYYIQYKYQFCYVYVNNRESGGMYFQQMFKFSMQLLMLSSMVNISYMGLKLGKLQAPLMFPLPVVIYGVWSYILYKFDRISNNASCRRAMAADNKHRCGGVAGADPADGDVEDDNIADGDVENDNPVDQTNNDKHINKIQLVSLMAPHEAKDRHGNVRAILVDKWGSPYFADSHDATDDAVVDDGSISRNSGGSINKKKVGNVVTVMKNEKNISRTSIEIDHDDDDNDDLKDNYHIDNCSKCEKNMDSNEEKCSAKRFDDFYLPALLLESIILEPFVYRIDDIPLFKRESTTCLIDTIHLNPIYNEPREISLDEIMSLYSTLDTAVV